jgi:hypothetical protein
MHLLCHITTSAGSVEDLGLSRLRDSPGWEGASREAGPTIKGNRRERESAGSTIRRLFVQQESTLQSGFDCTLEDGSLDIKVCAEVEVQRRGWEGRTDQVMVE